MTDDEITRAGERHNPATPSLDRSPSGTADTEASGRTAQASDAALQRAVPTSGRVGRYVVIDRVGAGGMGVVLAAYDPELDRRVALKLLAAGPESSVRLLREAQALARLSHPNVVQIHDVGVHDGQVFLAMELVAGQTLRAWLEAGPRPWRTIVRVFVEAGRGLAAAHAAGIVHRDFKPDNVLIGADGRARVADFGLARQLEGGDASAPKGAAAAAPSTAFAVPLTQSGVLLGTPAYMSPEQFDGGRADARSDLFAFCVALYEALYGRRPFRADDLTTLLAKIRAGALAEPPAASPVPRAIFEQLRRGLAYAPADRPASLERLLADLTHDRGARRRRWLLAGGLVALGGGAAAAALTWAMPAGEAACTSAETGLAELWNDGVKAALARSLAEVVRQPEQRERVQDGLQRYADAWSAARREACLDHRRGADSEAVRELRSRCLDRRRSAFEGAVRLVRATRPGDDVVRVVAGLPAIADCARVDALLAAPARDPARASEVAAVERRLDGARTLADAGRLGEADSEIAGALADAEALGDRGQVGQARLAAARVAMVRGAWVDAVSTLRLALADALAAGDDPTAAEAVARLVYGRAQTGHERPAEILGDVPVAQVLVDRQGPHAFARRRLLANLATVHLAAGDVAAARRTVVEATNDLESVVDADPFEAANFLRLLAVLTDDPARRRDGFTRSEAIFRELLGEDHLDLLNLRLYRGRTALDLAEADEQLTDACAGYDRVVAPAERRDPSCAECGLLLGGIAREREDLTAALARYGEAATCEAGAPRVGVDARRQLARAHGARLRGEFAEAIAAAERAAEMWAPYATADRPWIELPRAEAWLVQGEAELGRGDKAAARERLRLAHEVFARQAERQIDALPRFHRSRAAELLAELEWEDPAGRARARELAGEARAFHAGRGEAGAARVAALDAWLAAHPLAAR
ncbi:protein kinase domain-containing protein [Nannocystis pusilla]|uniref:protein kinase domain-containing protein n=1 Tax=Nannocystis pusilla TaxID=889268 RepID=UPI003BF3A5AE